MRKALVTIAAMGLFAAAAPAATTPPKIVIHNANITEGSTRTAVFSVTLNKKASRDVTVKFATADGTATAGSDYIATKGKVTIPEGKIRGRIKVKIIDDEVDEPDETFFVKLSHARHATLKDAKAKGTVFDDDVPPVGP